MAKRRLNHHQWRRIRDRQQRNGSDEQPAGSADQSPTQELGPECLGVIRCHYGQQLEVEYENAGSLATARCYQRANLPPLVAGDQVTWQPANTGGGVITALQPRRSVLIRPHEHDEDRLMAANVDLVVIVLAPHPRPFANLIDRYLAAVENLKLQAVLLLNKTDLADADACQPLLATYSGIGYPVLHTSYNEPASTQALGEYLDNRTAILIGQSGVGKSSLINRLLAAGGDADSAAVGEMSTGADKGRHTTTAARLYRLADGGAVIDSPGIREFGLWHMDREALLEGFVEFRPYLGQCRFRDCRHVKEPGCALRAAVEAGEISRQRLDSFFHINAEFSRR